MVYLLQQLLAEAARKTPGAPAVAFENESITYGELDRITDRLAAVLIAKGVRRGDRAGILMHKSIGSIVAIHGILKAGGAYVPLDPNAPAARIAYIIRDCGIKCLLASTRKLAALPEVFPLDNPLSTVVLLDGEGAPAADGLTCDVVAWERVKNGEAAPAPGPNPPPIEGDLAYILYTSGSTAEPKGVMISHRTSLTFVDWVGDTFGIRDDDRVANHAPLHFDLSILDIFAAFKAGACVVPVPETISTFPVRLAEWIARNRISIWYSVPSILSMLVLHAPLEQHDLSRLRIVFFAGEVFPVKMLRELMRKVPHADYYNLFGPTETNVITSYKVPPLAEDRTQPIPIGRPCANIDVFAVTDEGELVTRPGQRGELYARGPCVAQGYWGDPKKSAATFIRNFRQRCFEERLCRTGDIVGLDEDGNYLFAGRRDHMIKSRGYRIELGEVETTLYTHPGVEEAAVIAIPDELISNRLKAFVVPREGAVLETFDLKMFCGDRLPKYMVPELLDIRDRLPKTSTGKVDKPRLLAESVGAEPAGAGREASGAGRGGSAAPRPTSPPAAF